MAKVATNPFRGGVSPRWLRTHFEVLCLKIGERRAGSSGDLAAARYVLEQFKGAGLAEVHAEDFPCTFVARANVDLRIGKGSKLQRVLARVLAGSPGTSGRTVNGKLVWIEMPEQADRYLTSELRGKIAVLFGPMPTRADLHQRLVKSRPAAVIHVDDRLPFEWVKDDGVYPAWARLYGIPPTVTIPYRAAWELRKRGADRARVNVDVQLKQTVSQNLVAEIPGRRPDLPVIVLGAHHDTQCHNTGADDNGSGVVALLAMAKTLNAHGNKLLRTVRLISFGAEEQLSVGSAAYAHAHAKEMDSMGVVLNLDSVSSPLGHHWLLRAGTDDFGNWLVRQLSKAGLDVAQKTSPMPFADHFPFSAFQVPAVTFMRGNMDSGMRWQHHSRFDALNNISEVELHRVVNAVASVVRVLGRMETWPFQRGLAVHQRAETARLALEMFDIRNARA